MLAPYHARAGAELERFGGRVEKFVGDAVLAIFGAPIAYEDDPERAVRAALAIKEGVADLNAQDAWLDLHIRIGVHTGEALVMLGRQTGPGRVDRSRRRDEHCGAAPVAPRRPTGSSSARRPTTPRVE